MSSVDAAASRPVLLCFGYGYSAAALRRRLADQPGDWRVIGTTRRAEKAAAMEADGVDALLDVDTAGVAAAVAAATHILVSAGPDSDGVDPTLTAHGAALAATRPAWIGYLSTTGVYGDHRGGWVDETTPTEPTSTRGRARVAAENAWRAHADAQASPLHIFRLAGIYGPGRGPFAKVRAGAARRIIKPGQVFSRIHVEDIATVLLASIARPEGAPGEAAVYNVCDDEPAPPQDVLAHAAELLGVPVPPAVSFEEVAPSMSPMARSFYAESRRVSNDRLRDALGVTLAYPGYRQGLAAILAAETGE